MLGVKQFVCVACGTVYADVSAPPRCARCEASEFDRLGHGRQAAAYFAGE